MAHIRSRKHSNTIHPLVNQSLIALAVLSVPVAAQAQQAGTPEQTLPAINVKSAAEVPYKANTVSSPKLTQPLVDTTQTICAVGIGRPIGSLRLLLIGLVLGRDVNFVAS